MKVGGRVRMGSGARDGRGARAAAVTAALAAAVLLAAAGAARAAGCTWRGVAYADGASSCQGGAIMQCLGGEWVDQDESCSGRYGAAQGEIEMDTGGEQPVAPEDPFQSGATPVAPVAPGDAGSLE